MDQKVKQGYTRREAEALVNQVFETRTFLSSVPPRTRGHVIEAIDAGDHWNVMIEWHVAGKPSMTWYDKFDVQHAMRPINP